MQDEHFEALIDTGLQAEVYRSLNQKPWVEGHSSLADILKSAQIKPGAIEVVFFGQHPHHLLNRMVDSFARASYRNLSTDRLTGLAADLGNVKQEERP